MKIKLFAAMILGAFLLSCGEDPSQAYRNGGKKEEILTVEGWVIQPLVLPQSIQAVGSVIPDEEITLASEVNGKVQQIKFEEGDKVSKGQLLVLLDATEYVAQLQKAQSALDLALQTEERLSKLLALKAVSKEAYDQAQTELAQLKADVTYYKRLVEKCRISAPFSGRIGLRNISPGQFISSGTSIAKLVKNQPVKIEFTLPGEKAHAILPGQKIYFEVGQSQGESATVYATDPSLDPATRSLKARAKYHNKQEQLIPGNFLQLHVDLGTDSSAILVPTVAVETQIDGQVVYLIKNGKVKIQKVESAGRTDRYLKVASGLSAGDTVMLTGLLQAKPGIPVKSNRIVTKSDLESQE